MNPNTVNPFEIGSLLRREIGSYGATGAGPLPSATSNTTSSPAAFLKPMANLPWMVSNRN